MCITNNRYPYGVRAQSMEILNSYQTKVEEKIRISAASTLCELKAPVSFGSCLNLFIRTRIVFVCRKVGVHKSHTRNVMLIKEAHRSFP